MQESRSMDAAIATVLFIVLQSQDIDRPSSPIAQFAQECMKLPEWSGISRLHVNCPSWLPRQLLSRTCEATNHAPRASRHEADNFRSPWEPIRWDDISRQLVAKPPKADSGKAYRDMQRNSERMTPCTMGRWGRRVEKRRFLSVATPRYIYPFGIVTCRSLVLLPRPNANRVNAASMRSLTQPAGCSLRVAVEVSYSNPSQ